MKNQFILLSLMILGICPTAISCSVSQSPNANFAFAQTTPVLYGYSGVVFPTQPVYTVYQLKTPLTVYTTYSDSVSIAAYTDSKCTTKASGTLTATANPQSLDSGVATFAGVTYTATGSQEGIIHLGGTLVSGGVSYCSFSTSIIQHFVLGKGYLASGTTGAAGANTAATVYDSGLIHRIDSSGNYVVAGVSKNTGGGKELAIWRYFPNGTLDTSFGSPNGYIHSGTTGVAGASGASEVETVADLQIDSQGNYILVGTSVNGSGGTELALWKYKSSTGALDTTFGTSGTYHTGSPGLTGRNPLASVNDQPKSMKLDSSGNIIVTGTSQNAGNGYELFVARFTSSGALDSSFGTGGVYYPGTTGAAGASGASENDIGYSLQTDSTGNYVIAGTSAYSGGGSELTLWRLGSSGNLDTSFGGSGIVTAGTTGAASGTGANLADVGRSLQIDSNGNYVIAGTSKNTSGGIEMAIWKYSNMGSLDTSFANSGYIHFGTTGAAGASGSSANDVGASLAIDNTNGYYIVGGSSINASGGTQSVVWRYKTSGSLDTDFNSNGYVVSDSTGAAGGMTAATVNDSTQSLQFDTVGTYTAVGFTKNSSGGRELAIWRYLPTGTLDL